MPMETVTSILYIVDQLNTEKLTRIQAAIKLMGMDLIDAEQKFVKGICGLMQKLPRVSIREDVNEAELCSRFIEPFLSGLFDDPDQGYYLRWTNTRPLEAKTISADTAVERPDLCITKSLDHKWHHDSGFGEAKTAKMGESMYLVCKDLWRITIFCKDTMDSQNMQGIIGIQILGRLITFYVMVLPATGLYVMLELAELKIPDSLEELPKLVLDISRILKVLDVFNRVCVPLTDSALNNQCTITITNLSIPQLFTASQDRNRDSSLKRRHN
ncbi:hypothetical protein CLU79DRAFT_779276 [Phycomyces nitens]|nr:hypothetical protein CLU79DRAFT_779276 [Phycomyces nitens]